MKSSNAEERFRASLRVGLGVFLVAPLLIWIARVPTWSDPRAAGLYPALGRALLQASLSGAFALIIGAALALALQCFSRRRLPELALLLPNIVPPLFLILALIHLPRGMTAVVIAHVLLNAGLVAIAVDRLLRERAGGMAEAAWAMGVSRTSFLARVAWPYLRADLACLFLFVFGICLTSFSIPLLMGGSRHGSLEVAIYDSIRIEGRWDRAVILTITQVIVLATLAWMLPRGFFPARPARGSLEFWGWRRGKWFVYLPALVLSLGWLGGIAGGLRHWGEVSLTGLAGAAAASLALALGVGLLHLLLFLLVAYVSPHGGLTRFLNGYLAPSPAITGFALLLIPGESFIKLVVALTLISLPLLYRWIVASALGGLNGQIQVARMLGASWSKVLFEVVWPQAAPSVLRASGLAALWACGDFALTGILAEDLETLPLLMEGFIGAYRLEVAQALMPLLAVLGLTSYAFFVKLGRYVAR